MLIIGPKQIPAEIVDGTLVLHTGGTASYGHTVSDDVVSLKRGDVRSNQSAEKCYLHAPPRKAHKNCLEKSLRLSLEREMLERAFHGDVPDMKVLKLRKPRTDLKMYWAVRNKAAAVFTMLWKQLIAEHSDPDALKLARRFSIGQRWDIYKAAAMSTRARQAIEAYPLLGAAIYAFDALGETDSIREARRLVESGAKLKDVAASIGATMLARKIVPQCAFFAAPDVVDSAFALCPEVLHNHLPKTAIGQHRWLWFMRHSNEQIPGWQEWAAKNFPVKMKCEEANSAMTQIRDWYRVNPGANCSFATALERASAWHNEAAARRQVEWDARNAAYDRKREEEMRKPFPEPWLPSGTVDGFNVAALLNQAELADEGRAMHHCVQQYDHYVRTGKSYIYSIRRGEKRIATLELKRRGDQYEVAQLRGACNKEPEPEVFRAVRNWIFEMTKDCSVDGKDGFQTRMAGGM